jgi:hypothetical protein
VSDARIWQPSRCVLVLVLVVACGGGDGKGDSLAGSGGSGDTGAPGTERGPCYGNGTCNRGLTCASNLCVALGGTGGASAGGRSSAGGAGKGGVPSTGGTSSGGVSSGGQGGSTQGTDGGKGWGCEMAGKICSCNDQASSNSFVCPDTSCCLLYEYVAGTACQCQPTDTIDCPTIMMSYPNPKQLAHCPP